MILHICNDFSHSKVHANLYKELDNLGFSQKIFCPLRQERKRKSNVFTFKEPNSQIIYSRLLKKYHKFLFHSKIKFLYEDILNQIQPEKIYISFATTLFSDGAIAYRLWKDYQVPYIVSVRHTDVSLFLKYRPDLIDLALKILSNSEKILFLSPALKKNFFNHPRIKNYMDRWTKKIMIIPNGIDEFWLNNISPSNNNKGNKFLYVGTFERRKNVHKLIKALYSLKEFYPDIELTLIGGGGNKESPILEAVKKNSDWIRYLGIVTDKNLLLTEMRKHSFLAMVSHYETFGLVYLEALSQGLPILYTKNQGIDRLFDLNVGQAANPSSLEDIKRQLVYLISNKKNIEVDRIDFNKFSWKYIGSTYESLIFKFSKHH